MFTVLVLMCGADPTFEVTNRCPPAFVVINKCPAPAKPAKVTNGLNCTASFCGANGGAGCPSCPNGAGTCACGPATVKQSLTVPPPTFALPASQSSCPGGNCPQSTTGFYRRGLFR